jgi:DHA2 family multidrug resistance protein
MTYQDARTPQTTQERLPHKWKVLITVIFGLCMPLLDTTVVNVAFQTLRQEFGADLSDAQWVLSIYTLMLGISTPAAGFLADRFGIKRMYSIGLMLFVVGSLCCGFAPSLSFLIVSRMLQGCGAGIMLPLGTALLLGAFPIEERGLALGIFGIALVVAPATGPVLGGWLVDQGLWRWIFFINLPIGALGLLLAARLLREARPDRRPTFDLLGLLTSALGFGALLYAAAIARTAPLSQALVWFGVGLVGLVVFAYIELFVAKEPLLNLRLFGKRTFLISSLVGYVSVIALFGPEFLLPIYLQALRGRSAFETGSVLLPLALAAGITAPFAGRLHDLFGPRLVLVLGFGVLGINTWQLAQIQADTAISWLVFLMVLRGIALGLTLQTTIATALSVVPGEQLARGTSLVNATRQVMIAIGVAAMASILAGSLSSDARAFLRQSQEQSRNLSAGPQPGLCEMAAGGMSGGEAAVPLLASAVDLPQSTPGAQVDARICDELIAGFENTYTVTFYLALLSMLLSALLPGWPRAWAGRAATSAPVASE